ncbi:hypothetical protein TRFO_10935 [Tritrichomonas foetus]|uniref:Uncharacterized protein n=1 Tax=Tritrichomonas foetus TaxID=1144522 RepID=A0A1J4J7W4_9EUKA|nr:hypothetical protein TRFO_10935 [Tritrichomonas foetus]|eukprot:OHS94761.1 hypothetical protein TRFO_10935 [Tritrichomonas foetus]
MIASNQISPKTIFPHAILKQPEMKFDVFSTSTTYQNTLHFSIDDSEDHQMILENIFEVNDYNWKALCKYSIKAHNH